MLEEDFALALAKEHAQRLRSDAARYRLAAAVDGRRRHRRGRWWSWSRRDSNASTCQR